MLCRAGEHSGRCHRFRFRVDPPPSSCSPLTMGRKHDGHRTTTNHCSASSTPDRPLQINERGRSSDQNRKRCLGCYVCSDAYIPLPINGGRLRAETTRKTVSTVLPPPPPNDHMSRPGGPLVDAPNGRGVQETPRRALPEQRGAFG